MNNATKTEVIGLEDSNVICEDLEDFPLEAAGAVGANLASTPIICGGEKCFKYMKGGWQHFATMIERRDSAAEIVYNNALHIFGGQDNAKELQSSEIVKEDGSVTEGPHLPTQLWGHAIASINSTVSVMTGGGFIGFPSNQTWYFNHTSQEFQPGPNLLRSRYLHSSGSVTDQKTKEKMIIIAGGRSIGLVNLKSTEMLLNDEWKKGKTHTESYICLFLYTFKLD